MLHDFVELFEEVEVVGVDRVDLEPEMFTNFCCGGLAAPRAGTSVRVLEVLHRAGEVAVLDEGAQDDQVGVRARLQHEVALGWDRAGVARRHQQILAALALVGARRRRR